MPTACVDCIASAIGGDDGVVAVAGVYRPAGQQLTRLRRWRCHWRGLLLCRKYNAVAATARNRRARAASVEELQIAGAGGEHRLPLAAGAGNDRIGCHTDHCLIAWRQDR